MSSIPPQKKRKRQTKIQPKKQTKQKTKTENTHTLTLWIPSKHCDVCGIIFYHVVTLLLARGCQKRDNEVLQRDFVFPWQYVTLGCNWVTLTRACVDMVGVSCDIFTSCFTSICLYTKKLSIFKTTSFFGVSALKRLSYNRTSETFQSIILLYKKKTCDPTDVLTIKCCFCVSLALISIHSMTAVIILRSCVMKLNRFFLSFSSFSRSNQEVYVRILARRVLGL